MSRITKGQTTDFKTTLDSVVAEHDSAKEIKRADNIVLKISGKARKMDKVFKLVED